MAIGDTTFCEECHRYRGIEDEHDEVALTSASHSHSTTEVGYHVVDLSCGHSKSRRSGHDTTYRDAGA